MNKITPEAHDSEQNQEANDLHDSMPTNKVKLINTSVLDHIQKLHDKEIARLGKQIEDMAKTIGERNININNLNSWLTHKDKQITARDSSMRVREKVAELWEGRYKEIKTALAEIEKVLTQYCHCRRDEDIDTSVGQEYESCPACEQLTKIQTITGD